MPQGAAAINAAPQPSRSVNVVGAVAGQQVKTGPGCFRGFSVNTAGTSSTFVAYDGTSPSGTKLGTWSTTAQANFDGLNLAFTVGLFLVTTGTVADLTVQYL